MNNIEAAVRIVNSRAVGWLALAIAIILVVTYASRVFDLAEKVHETYHEK